MKHRSFIRFAVALLWLFTALPSMLSAQSGTPTEVTVFAAASLTEAFRTLGKQFEAAHSGTRLQFNFAGSQQLVQQLALGANADLFAAADKKQMSAAVSAGIVDTATIRTFARNRLVVIAPHDNPGHLTRLADLAKERLKIILADSAVPVGRYARQFLDRAGKNPAFGPAFPRRVLANVVSYEENVRAVLAKVQLGEADAGIVYTSDLAGDSAGIITRIGIPDDLNVVAEYPIALVRRSRAGGAGAAAGFVEYLLSAAGQKVLARFGFIPIAPDAPLEPKKR